jgi:hypothetical protein
MKPRVTRLDENGGVDVPSPADTAHHHAWYPMGCVAIAQLHPVDQGRLDRIAVLDATMP